MSSRDAVGGPLHGFLSTLSLVCRVPVPLRGEPDFSSFGLWMPLAGLCAAACACAGAALGIAAFGPGLLAALCALVAQYLPFNLFHLDGLLDTADASGVGGDDAEKRRSVLKDPRIGSFALFAGFVALAGRLGATSALLARGGPAAWGALALAPVAGRYASVLVTAFAEPYGTGLGSLVGRQPAVRSTLGYAVAAIPAMLLFGAAYGAIGTAAAVLAGGLSAVAVAAFLGSWYGRRLGGYSGDALGAAVELGELVVLLLAAALAR